MRALKVLVVGMGVLIVVGTVTLVVLVIQRAGKAMPGAAPVVVAGQVGLPLASGLTLGQPAEARIGGIAPGGEGRVAVWVQRPDGDRVVILDTRNGQAVGEIRLGE